MVRRRTGSAFHSSPVAVFGGTLNGLANEFGCRHDPSHQQSRVPDNPMKILARLLKVRAIP
jgi:hypothetical protein